MLPLVACINILSWFVEAGTGAAVASKATQSWKATTEKMPILNDLVLIFLIATKSERERRDEALGN